MKRTIKYGNDKFITDELTNQSVIGQTFTAEGKKLNAIAIDFGTYKRDYNQGVLVFKIFNNLDQKLFETGINVNQLKNNKFFEIKTDINLEVGKKYFLIFYNLKGTFGSSVCVKYGTNIKTSETFTINRKEIKGGQLHCMFAFNEVPKKEQKNEEIVKELSDINDQEKYEKEEKEKFIKEQEDNKTLNMTNVKEEIEKEILESIDNTEDGLISVIVPVYNNVELLQETLDSISKQTYNNYEIIVVDDGSDQKYKDKIKKIAKGTNFISYKENKGACYARNKGSKKANGQYLFFCDSDVKLDPECFEEMINTLYQNDYASWVYSNYKLGRKHMKFQKFNIDTLCKKNICSTMSLIKASDFPGFDENIQRLQDWDLFLTMVENGKLGVWVDKILFTARKRPGITTDSISWDEAVKEIKKKHRIVK